MNVAPVAPLALENILVHLATLGFRFCCRIFARTRQQFVDANDKPFVSGDALPVFKIHRRLEILVKEPYAIHDAPAPESGRLADDTAALELLELKLARIELPQKPALLVGGCGDAIKWAQRVVVTRTIIALTWKRKGQFID
jgi:hypothetical protein